MPTARSYSSTPAKPAAPATRWFAAAGGIVLQAVIAAGLLALVALGVSFDAITRVVAHHLRLFAASLGTDLRMAIGLSAWVAVLIGVLWILEVSPLHLYARARRGRRFATAWYRSLRAPQWLAFAAGSLLVACGAAALVVLVQSGAPAG